MCASEVCMLPTEGIWEKEMKKGHEVMKNPVLRDWVLDPEAHSS